MGLVDSYHEGRVLFPIAYDMSMETLSLRQHRAPHLGFGSVLKACTAMTADTVTGKMTPRSR